MAQIEVYRNNLRRKKDQLSKLLNDRAKHETNASNYKIKAEKAQNAANRAKTRSTSNNKLKEAERNSKSATQEEKKVAELNKKIADKQKEVQQIQSKIEKEETRINKKEMQKISKSLAKQEQIQKETQMDLECLKKLPEQVTIGFFSANPRDQSQLSLDEEVRSIEENLRKSEYRDSIKLQSFWAVRPKDIIQKLNEYNPKIVHFSGHGSSQDELVFQDDFGGTKLVSKEAIVNTMTTMSDCIRVVFFNTCYSQEQAESIVTHVEAAIGMNNSISDNAAREFAAQFYSSIGFGQSIKKAFDQAKAALMLEGIREDNIPELFVQSGLSPDEIIIVKPESIE